VDPRVLVNKVSQKRDNEMKTAKIWSLLVLLNTALALCAAPEEKTAQLTPEEITKAKTIYAKVFITKGHDENGNTVTSIFPSVESNAEYSKKVVYDTGVYKMGVRQLSDKPLYKNQRGIPVRYNKLFLCIDVKDEAPLLRMKMLRADKLSSVMSYVFHIDDKVVTLGPCKPSKRGNGDDYWWYEAPANIDLIQQMIKGNIVTLRCQGVNEHSDRQITVTEKKWVEDMYLVYRYLKEQHAGKL
jgi:hypothetical protein